MSSPQLHQERLIEVVIQASCESSMLVVFFHTWNG